MKAVAGQTWVSKSHKNKWGQPHAVVIVNPLEFLGLGTKPTDPALVQSASSGRRYEMERRTLFYKFELEG